MTALCLFLTVGGSHQPLVKAIRDTRPDRVVFFCTDRDPATDRPGSRTQVESGGLCIKAAPADPHASLPNIPSQCLLAPDQFELVLVPADDLDEAYRLMRRSLIRYADHVCVADYTGGTKTMSAALAVAALDTPKAQLQLVAGTRADLIKTRDGTEEVVAASVVRIRFQRELRLHLGHWSTFNYAASVTGIEAMPTPGLAELRAQRQQALGLSRAMEAWDCFDHRQASASMEDFRSVVGSSMAPYYNVLSILNSEVSAKSEATQLMDLMLNAERRASNGRYDDATARIYRLLEWTAQYVLKWQHGWRTGELPEPVAVEHGIAPGPKGKYQTGLRGAWQLVAKHCPGPAADFFSIHGDAMLHHVLMRNDSILAHGNKAISRDDWEALWAWAQPQLSALLGHLLKQAGVRQPAQQLPQRYPLLDKLEQP